MFEYLINALSIFVNFTSNIVSVVNELELGRVCKTNAFSSTYCTGIFLAFFLLSLVIV